MRPVFPRVAAACIGFFLLGLAVVAQNGAQSAGPAASAAATPFAAEIERLSEPEGTFDTDNLISNESGYLHVVPTLVSKGVTGGAYLGVGPDQNFSYIARIRPEVAFIIDIRRDNLLLHLLFKALFARAHSRVEYVALLTGRAPPRDVERWKAADLKDIVAYIDGAMPSPEAGALVGARPRDD